MSDCDNFRGDVWYDEWRAGLPEGSISDEQIDDAHYSGRSSESLVSEACQRRDDRRQQREAEAYAQMYHEEEERRQYEEAPEPEAPDG